MARHNHRREQAVETRAAGWLDTQRHEERSYWQAAVMPLQYLVCFKFLGERTWQTRL